MVLKKTDVFLVTLSLGIIIVLLWYTHARASEPPHKPIPRRAAQDPIEIPETRSQDFPGVKVIHRNNTPPMPTRVEGSRDLRKQAAKNAHHNRLMTLLNCCKGKGDK